MKIFPSDSKDTLTSLLKKRNLQENKELSI